MQATATSVFVCTLNHQATRRLDGLQSLGFYFVGGSCCLRETGEGRAGIGMHQQICGKMGGAKGRTVSLSGLVCSCIGSVMCV